LPNKTLKTGLAHVVVWWQNLAVKPHISIIASYNTKHIINTIKGRNLSRVFFFRSGHLHAANLWCFRVKLPNLKLKTRPAQLLDSLPLDITLPVQSKNWHRYSKKQKKIWKYLQARKSIIPLFGVTLQHGPLCALYYKTITIVSDDRR